MMVRPLVLDLLFQKHMNNKNIEKMIQGNTAVTKSHAVYIPKVVSL